VDAEATADETPAQFNAEHYGDCGLNGRFLTGDAIREFAGPNCGGGGRFEDPEKRDIAVSPYGATSCEAVQKKADQAVCMCWEVEVDDRQCGRQADLA
jgi:hypothetical protein